MHMSLVSPVAVHGPVHQTRAHNVAQVTIDKRMVAILIAIVSLLTDADERFGCVQVGQS